MIVIPMAGQSARFARAGYGKPKYMLPLRGGTVFDSAVGSFSRYFDQLPFVLVTQAGEDVAAFVEARTRALGIKDVRIIPLAGPTAGQAETVEMGLAGAGARDDEPVTIFNIDTFRPGFAYPDQPWFKRSDGYLEVFEGEGANWSYVRPASTYEEPTVSETAEKRPISDLCCTGLYHFARMSDMLRALEQERADPGAPELYVAPIYNHLIRTGARIHYQRISRSEVEFCGVPEEYEALLNLEGGEGDI